MSEVIRFFWLRHGPTHQKAFTGWRDVPADLSDLALIGRIRAGLPQDGLLVSSDLMRARDTATALQNGQSRLPHDPALREMDFGDWDGLEFPEVARRDPVLSRAYWETPGDLRAPGGESWNQTSARIEGAALRLSRLCAGRPLIVVAHLGVILTQLGRAKQQPPQQIIGQDIRPLSLTEIAWHPNGRREVLRVNELPDPG